MSRRDGVLRTTRTHGTHQTAKERLIVLRGLSRISRVSQGELIILIYLGGVSLISY